MLYFGHESSISFPYLPDILSEIDCSTNHPGPDPEPMAI
jgi:hypothetical protein